MWEAIQEFGWDNIQHIILESDVPEEEVSRKERQYIDQYDSANLEKGYNRQRGGLSGESSYYDEDQIKTTNGFAIIAGVIRMMTQSL